MSLAKILVVEDDGTLQRVVQAQLVQMGVQVAVAGTVTHALEILRAEMQDLVLTDLNLPGRSGLELLKTIRAEYPETSVILMTAYGTIETAVQAMKSGAYDYVTKPLHPYELRSLVSRVLERKSLIEEVRMLRSNIDKKFGFESILGNSNALLRVLDAAAHVAGTNATVLILGETGTGKELLAKAIHFNSVRRDRPFVVINCAAIPRELLESELFGHVRGAFTGASTHKKGKVELADGGTVFLDEIGEMPLELQVRLLRLVQEREIEKVGAVRPIQVDVRIVAATHRNLEDLVKQGEFREDLYYRLAVVPLILPPLRDRKEDLPELVQYFFENTKRRHGKDDLRLPHSLLPYFQNHDWPGNVRELENTISRIIVMCRGAEVTLADLPAFLHSAPPGVATGVATGGAGTQTATLPEEDRSLQAVERNLIVSALRKFNGNQSSAARHLSITRKVLMNRIAKYHISKMEMQGEPVHPASESAIPSAKPSGKQDLLAKAAQKRAV
jgi:DNA-binding NtrC family response regulator